MIAKAIRIVQISDMHLLADDEAVLLGVKTTASFQAVIDAVSMDPVKPDVLILSGDLSQDESATSYRKLANQISTLHIPTYCIPGNHDNVEVMADVFPQQMVSVDKQMLLPGWQLILLESQRRGAVEGYLEPIQLAYLEQCLEAHPERHAIIVLHHHPVPIGSAWIDKIGLTNADVFWDVLAHYPKVKAVLFGHIHQHHESKKNAILCLAVPSTCIQFQPLSDKFGLQNIPQGYRWLNLYEDGRLETGITRLPNYVGFFDPNAKGY